MLYFADLNNGLVAYYPFNGNANDESGNGNHGTVNGATLTTDRLGNANSAYSFNGSSYYIKVADSNSLDITSSISFSSWIYVYGSTNDHQVIIGKWYNNNVFEETYVLELQPNGKTIQMPLNGISTGGYSNVASNTEISFNTWVHVVGVYDSSEIRLYVNGVKTGSLITSGNLPLTSAPLMIGAHDSTSDRNAFNGIIDDVRIYNRALSSSEIEELYNYGGTPTAPTATTKSATNVKSTSATLDGTVNANGGTTTAWFEYGTTSGTYSSTTSTQTISSGWSDTSVTTDISGLSSKTTYYYRLVAQNSVGTTYGSELSFATTAPPTVTTGSGTNITMISATLNGTVNANGTSTTAWFEYGKTSGAYDKTTTTQGVSGSSDTSVSIYVSGLSSELAITTGWLRRTTQVFRMAAKIRLPRLHRQPLCQHRRRPRIMGWSHITHSTAMPMTKVEMGIMGLFTGLP